MEPFLAKFFEPCADVRSAAFLGTETGTRIRSEEPDADASRRLDSGVALGTQTVTEIGGEQSDADPQSSAILLGTQTMTKVTNESADTDPERRFQSLMWGASIL